MIPIGFALLFLQYASDAIKSSFKLRST
jgi:TRAP-type mannitol/chloroaromatic compound transport system permease small subunit